MKEPSVYITALFILLKGLGIWIGFIHPKREKNLVITLIWYGFIFSEIGSAMFLAKMLGSEIATSIYGYHYIISDLFFSISICIIVYRSIMGNAARRLTLILGLLANFLLISDFILHAKSLDNTPSAWYIRLCTYATEIILPLVYYLELFQNNYDKQLKNDPVFWWVSGFFLIAALDLPLLFLNSENLDQSSFLVLLKFSLMFIHILISLKAILCGFKLKSQIKQFL